MKNVMKDIKKDINRLFGLSRALWGLLIFPNLRKLLNWDKTRSFYLLFLYTNALLKSFPLNFVLTFGYKLNFPHFRCCFLGFNLTTLSSTHQKWLTRNYLYIPNLRLLLRKLKLLLLWSWKSRVRSDAFISPSLRSKQSSSLAYP